MRKLISVFASALIAASLFVGVAYAANDSQMINTQTVQTSGGGPYEQCFREGNPGCK